MTAWAEGWAGSAPPERPMTNATRSELLRRAAKALVRWHAEIQSESSEPVVS